MTFTKYHIVSKFWNKSFTRYNEGLFPPSSVKRLKIIYAVDKTAIYFVLINIEIGSLGIMTMQSHLIYLHVKWLCYLQSSYQM